jgi:hypothetical protein
MNMDLLFRFPGMPKETQPRKDIDYTPIKLLLFALLELTSWLSRRWVAKMKPSTVILVAKRSEHEAVSQGGWCPSWLKLRLYSIFLIINSQI